MKHIFDIEGSKWFQLESLEEAQTDAIHTQDQGADRFWSLTESGSKFYVLRDEQDLTILTTCIFGTEGWQTLESKATDRDVDAGMSTALKALAEHVGFDNPTFLNHGASFKDLLDDIGMEP